MRHVVAAAIRRRLRAAFNAIYPDLAKTYGAVFYPFFLDGVVTDPKLNQRDGLHPTAAGVDVIVANILPAVERADGAAKDQAVARASGNANRRETVASSTGIHQLAS